MCFFFFLSTVWEQRRLRPEHCESIVHHVEVQWGEKEIRGPRSAVSPLPGTGNMLICPQLKGFLMGITRSGQSIGSSWRPPEQGGRLCSSPAIILWLLCSNCFFHVHINFTYVCMYIQNNMHMLYMCLYANKHQGLWKASSLPFCAPQRQDLQEDLTARPQVPAAHEYAALTFETLPQISQPLSSLTPIPFQSQGFSNKHRWFQAACRRYFLK